MNIEFDLCAGAGEEVSQLSGYGQKKSRLETIDDESDCSQVPSLLFEHTKITNLPYLALLSFPTFSSPPVFVPGCGGMGRRRRLHS